jgi:hypothetical protein
MIKSTQKFSFYFNPDLNLFCTWFVWIALQLRSDWKRLVGEYSGLVETPCTEHSGIRSIVFKKKN